MLFSGRARKAKTLEEWAAEFRAGGKASLGRSAGMPMLGYCGAGESAPASYDTVAADTSWETKVTLAGARSGDMKVDLVALSRVTEVYPIAKRAGGAFPDRIGVGRARSADVSIPLPGISKYHAYFSVVDETGGMTLHEAKALNGTFVNGTRLTAGQSADVVHGSHVAFGDEPFLYFSSEGFLELLNRLR